jgi:hypothetical protein
MVAPYMLVPDAGTRRLSSKALITAWYNVPYTWRSEIKTRKGLSVGLLFHNRKQNRVIMSSTGRDCISCSLKMINIGSTDFFTSIPRARAKPLHFYGLQSEATCSDFISVHTLLAAGLSHGTMRYPWAITVWLILYEVWDNATLLRV